jgi:dTDP-4-amino-4,6-dideoxygalactose transaminase
MSPIHLSEPLFDQAELRQVGLALQQRASGDGPFCERVEARLSERLAGRAVLLTTSCTHALELALLAFGIGEGDEVISPSFAFSSTANATLRVGARPVFADIAEDTLGLDPEDVERRMSARTAAVIPVHYAGRAVDMEGLHALARERPFRIIEDSAHGLDASYRGQPLGTLGDAGCFSFHETKNITCGEGGALVLEDPEIVRRAEVIREKGTNRQAFLRGEVDRYTWVAEGSSYVLSDVLAAILDAQLDKLEEIQRRRLGVLDRYVVELSDWALAKGVRLQTPLPEREENGHLFFMLLPSVRARDRAIDQLRTAGIMATFHFVPLHTAPYSEAAGIPPASLPVTERVAATLLRLPIHPRMTESDVDRVVEAVRRLSL